MVAWFSRPPVRAALLTGLMIGWPLMVTGQPEHRGGGAPPRMPPPHFHEAPPNFRGSLPHVGHPPPTSAPQHVLGRPGRDVGSFRGHTFAQFTPQEMSAWQGGAWRHVSHNGHLGWWWNVGDDWYFYPQPVYPYPPYIGSDDYFDYYDEYGPPSYYWYHCEDPAGYYPDVQQCNGPWEPVPPTPDQE